jgi:hypothetical protein
MTQSGSAAFRPLTLKMLALRAGAEADADAIASAVRRTYDDLARVSVPLIGRVGLEALTGRAVHLTQRECPGLNASADSARRGQGAGPFAQIVEALAQQEPALATDCAAALIGTLTGLLVTFIGEPLTLGLLRKAWPDAFHDSGTTET